MTKLFSDLKCGGKEQALEQARQWRDSYPIPDNERPQMPYRYLKKRPRRNTTGRVGVNQTVKYGRNGTPMPCFQVSWSPEPYHSKNKAFYISQYNSRQEAFEDACRFREEREREIDQRREAVMGQSRSLNAPKDQTAI